MEKKIFKPALIFGNHMILQREKPVPVWGTGVDGKTVTVSILDREASAVVKEGKWQVELPAMDACRGTVMTIQCGEEKFVIEDVAVGEVWLAGGQSNMEFYLRYDAEHDFVVENGENPDIYFFDYPEVSYVGQIEENDYSNFGFWRACNKENMDYYSAVAYYFADKLQKKYQIPVGIVGCNWGGTTASCWMSEDYLRGNEGSIWLEEYEEAIKTLDLKNYEEVFAVNGLSYTGKPFENPANEVLLKGLPKEQMIALIPEFEKAKDTMMPPVGPKSAWRPCGVYYSMLKEVAPYGICGVIWYQGESDDIHADVYETVFSNMIRCWRDLWNDEFPFLFTQIAPLGNWFSGIPEAFPLIREKQELVSKHIPKVWLTSIGDVGMEWDIHPKKKRPVGERLALLAIGHVYGEDIQCDPPECIGMEVEDGKVTLRFAHAEGGLILEGDSVNAIECRKNGELLDSCMVKVEEDTFFIQDDSIKGNDKIEVRFAVGEYYEVNMFNQAGVPIRPFKIYSV